MTMASTTAGDQTSRNEMDADSIAFMAMQPPAPSIPPTPAMAREMQRRSRLANQPDLPQVASIREYAVPGPAGPIPLRVYRGAGTSITEALPVQVYCHGGGWVVGDLDSHDWICRMVANAATCAVVSVDCRLAPEHRFPAAFDDALAATTWVAANAALLRIDPARISVGGDSAGGNLVAATALALRGHREIKLCAQILIYPALDLTAAYYGRFPAGVFLTDERMRTYITEYAPNADLHKDWRASPLFAPTLKGLPPALVILAGFDPLHDEGAAYAARLKDEGVPVTVTRYPGQMHGFMSRAKLSPKAYDAVADVAAVLKANH